MTRTYNPIMERTDVPRRWFGLKSSIPAPELGTAVVLVRKAAEPIVIWHGQRLPSTKVREHRRYIIDVANHGVSFEMRAASANPVFPFTVTVELACRVLAPYTIARDNIQDVTAALMPSLAREVRDTAARFDVLQPTEAARAIELRLGSAHPSGDVELSGYSVRVVPENTQGVVQAKQELGVQQLWREELQEVSHGSPEQQMAQLLATNDGNVREVLAYLASERDAEAEIKLKALQIAMGGNLEDMDVADVQRNAFSNIFGGNGNGGKQETMRERLERRTKVTIEGAEVVVEHSKPAASAEKASGGPAGKSAEKQAPESGAKAAPSDGQ
jgi:hypothetical protein